MSERYSILYSLPANLYAAGAPLLVAAGNLLKDNTTQKLLVQLKLHSLTVRKIRAATVQIQPQDTARRPLGGAISYNYLDLQVEAGEDFGQKIAIPMPENEARAYSVMVKEVIFDDGRLWQESGEAWEPLPEGEKLEKALGDSELVKQYRLRFGKDSVYLPAEYGDLWHCSCGAWNKGAHCSACKKDKAVLLPLNRAELAAEKDARLAREKAELEEREAEERARLARKKAELEERAARAAVLKKRVKKIVPLCAAAALLCLAAFLVITKVVIPGNAYRNAASLFEAGQYDEAIAAFEALGDYKDSAGQIELVKQEKAYQAALALCEDGRYDEAVAAFEALRDYKDSAEQIVRIGEAKYESDYQAALSLEQSGESYAAATAFYAMSDYKDARTHCFDLWRTLALRETLSVGVNHTVGLKADGTVVAVGDNKNGQCDVGGWTDIAAVSAGANHTVGLKSDGTVVAVGGNAFGQCDVGGWTDIVAVSAGTNHTVGLKADGTVVAVGWNKYGQCDIGDWTEIIAVSAGSGYTVGLKADGTVVTVGDNKEGKCNVDNWKTITAVSAGSIHTMGLKADGTIIAVGDKFFRSKFGGWQNIVAVSAGNVHTVGMKADGTVLAVGSNAFGKCDVSGWTDIVAVAAGEDHTVGLKADGTVVAVGKNDAGQCNVGDWVLKLPD